MQSRQEFKQYEPPRPNFQPKVLELSSKRLGISLDDVDFGVMTHVRSQRDCEMHSTEKLFA